MATKTKQKRGVSAERLKKEFQGYVLDHGDYPTSVYSFSKSLKIDEEEFYKHFNSFHALEKSIWRDWFEETVKLLEKDKSFAEYAVREQWLALYFTWIEQLKSHRSYVLFRFARFDKKNLNPSYLSSLKQEFEHFAAQLVAAGRESGEIAKRPFADKYHKGFWFHFLMVTQFWANDESAEFQQTDAFIEKSVHFAMDTLATGPLESFFDLAKFVYQSKKPF